MMYSENGEAIQILHYEHGQKYEPHFDFFHDKINQAMGDHRIATVLMYLSDIVKGGETVFPNSEVSNFASLQWTYFFLPPSDVCLNSKLYRVFAIYSVI